MTVARLKLGQLLPTPSQFQPNRTIVGRRYLYQIDDGRQICRRLPKHWDDDTPSGYYRVDDAPIKPRWRINHTLRTLKHAVAIPTLAAGLVAGLLLVAYPLLPGIKYQVQKQVAGYSNTKAVAAADPAHNRLIIPKIGVDTTILEGPSLAILNKYDGVWHQTGPITDNFVVAGHRFKYLPPNTSTFYNLGEIQVGDTILVDWYGTRHVYTVTQTETVDQHDTAILKPTGTSEVTIYTCYDKRQTQRIVVIAKPQP